MNNGMLEDLPHLKSITDNSTNQVGIVLPKKSLYHYTPSVSAVKNIVSNGELWLSKSTFMNDKFEISYGLSVAKEVFDEYDTPLVKRIAEVLSKNISDDYFILCFSGNSNSRFLWNYYSNKNGYALEFKPEFISDFINSERRKLLIFEGAQYHETLGGRKIALKEQCNLPADIPGYAYEYKANYVLYDKAEQTGIIRELVEYMIKHEHEISLFTQAGWLLSSVILFFKDPFFKDEEEYRLIIKTESSNTHSPIKSNNYLRRIVNYREKNNCLIPYLTLTMDNPCEYIESIGIGYGNREPYAKFSLEDFVSVYSKDIRVYEVQAPLQMY